MKDQKASWRANVFLLLRTGSSRGIADSISTFEPELEYCYLEFSWNLMWRLGYLVWCTSYEFYFFLRIFIWQWSCYLFHTWQNFLFYFWTHLNRYWFCLTFSWSFLWCLRKFWHRWVRCCHSCTFLLKIRGFQKLMRFHYNFSWECHM